MARPWTRATLSRTSPAAPRQPCQPAEPSNPAELAANPAELAAGTVEPAEPAFRMAKTGLGRRHLGQTGTGVAGPVEPADSAAALAAGLAKPATGSAGLAGRAAGSTKPAPGLREPATGAAKLRALPNCGLCRTGTASRPCPQLAADARRRVGQTCRRLSRAWDERTPAASREPAFEPAAAPRESAASPAHARSSVAAARRVAQARRVRLALGSGAQAPPVARGCGSVGWVWDPSGAVAPPLLFPATNSSFPFIPEAGFTIG